MIVVDIEASGLDPRTHSIVSIGAIDFTKPERIFYEECRIWDGAHVDDEALKITGLTLEYIQDKNKLSEREVVEHFLKWALEADEHTLAGQNPSFDRNFLEEAAHRYHINWPLAHRTIDLHSVCYYHMIKNGKGAPVSNKRSDLNLDRILKYVGVGMERGKHNALEDAKLEAEAFQRLFYDKNLFTEYVEFKIPWSI